MNRRIVFSAQADRDRDDIWDYTVERWSEDQAENYLIGLDRLLKTLRDEPQISREWRNVAPPVRTYRYQSHIVIFTADDATLDVIRVVHARTNWQALLAE